MQDFLENLFGDDLTPERRIAVFTTPQRRSRFFADYQQLEAYAAEQSPTQNVYFGVGLIQENPQGRGKINNIAAIGGLWCDIDVSGPAHPKGNLPKSIEEANSLLAEMPLSASVVVASGHGLHAYWLFQEPWLFANEEERKHAASLAKRWHGKVCAIAARRGWGLENLGDLTRVLRLPGTLNHNGDRPVDVKILQFEPEKRYATDDFEQFLSVETKTPAQADIGSLVLHPDAEPPAIKLLEAASKSPAFWETWNRQRADLADQSQSGYDLSLATLASLQGWSDQEIANLIIAARRHHNQQPEKALRYDYVQRTIGKARQTASAGDAEPVDLSGIIGRAEPDEMESAFVIPEKPDSFPLELIDRAPEIVQRAMDYYRQCAVEVQPVLFLASLVAATGAVLGHKVKDVSGLRTNIYTLGILSTGAGKEMTREAIYQIFRHAGIAPMCGQEDLGSDAGLVTAIQGQNPILFQIDEFGRFMHALNSGGARNPHLYNIVSALLKLYSKAGSTFRTKAYADAKRYKEIEQPHVCIYGTTVSRNFWRAMNTDSLEGGFLPRLVIFEADDKEEIGGEQETDPPRELADFFSFWANRRISGGNLEREHPQPMIVPYTPDAKALLDELRKHQKREQRRLGDLGPIWTRARENAGKLAIIHACWRNRETPVVDIDSAQWAIDVIHHTVAHAVYQANLCMVDGPFHERCQLIMQAVERAEGRRLTQTDLYLATRNMTPRERQEALNTLLEQKRLRDWKVESGGRPAVCYGVP